MARKIYDCFTFFNELDLLDLRLEEHNDHVDFFVIAESNKSHQGTDKPYNLEINWDRYSKYHDKIIYVKVDDMPQSSHTWTLENFQRNALARGYANANDNDVIIISDCDEMLRASTFELLRNDFQHHLWICRQPIFWAKLNYWQSEPRGYNISSMAMTKLHMIPPQDLRNMCHWALYNLPEEYSDETKMVIQHAGWHFTYLGDDRQAKTKLLNFAHDEARYLADSVNANSMEEAISNNRNPIAPNNSGTFKRVALDEYFPKAVYNNQERWKDLIVTDIEANIKDFLPPYESN